VNIRGLERWIGDHASPAAAPAAETPARRRRVAIVGGGPAGLGAAFALGRAGHEVTLLDAEPKLGGVLRTGIPSYRLPHEVLDRDIERILALGVVARLGAALGPEAVRELSLAHDAVIVATGLAAVGSLACPGADLAGVEQGLSFLHAVKSGVAREVHGHVVVVGGGNTAVDCARTALRCGASRVTLTYRRGREEMPAIAEEIEEAVAEGVSLLVLRQPVRFTGEGRVSAVELAEVELGPADASGRRRPVVTARTCALPCDAVLLAVGQSADLGVLPSGWTVRDGRAASADGPRNVWLAGDLATSEGTVSHAIGHGRRVAARVLRALDGEEDAPAAAARVEDAVAPADVRFSYFAPEPPHRDRHQHADRLSASGEVNFGLPGPQEAERCFSCGRCTRCDTCLHYCPEGIIRREGDGYAIDGRYCKGCGMCVAECPRRAMEMTAEGRA
jgi:NADPH-dependent glutamate synthase beta subunit-like oxidoreductase/NAD-dependent dihydropyrimidine dehydrogenase PreA subunit